MGSGVGDAVGADVGDAVGLGFCTMVGLTGAATLAGQIAAGERFTFSCMYI